MVPLIHDLVNVALNQRGYDVLQGDLLAENLEARVFIGSAGALVRFVRNDRVAECELPQGAVDAIASGDVSHLELGMDEAEALTASPGPLFAGRYTVDVG